jgi:hypothetical protein
VAVDTDVPHRLRELRLRIRHRSSEFPDRRNLANLTQRELCSDRGLGLHNQFGRSLAADTETVPVDVEAMPQVFVPLPRQISGPED